MPSFKSRKIMTAQCRYSGPWISSPSTRRMHFKQSPWQMNKLKSELLLLKIEIKLFFDKKKWREIGPQRCSSEKEQDSSQPPSSLEIEPPKVEAAWAEVDLIRALTKVQSPNLKRLTKVQGPHQTEDQTKVQNLIRAQDRLIIDFWCTLPQLQC